MSQFVCRGAVFQKGSVLCHRAELLLSLCHRAGSVGAQQVALAVLSLVFLRDRTLELVVSHQVTPQILALGTGTAVGPHIQPRSFVGQSDPGPGQLCSAVADSAAHPSTVHVSS